MISNQTRITYNAGGLFRGKNSDQVLEDDLVEMIVRYKPVIFTLQEVHDRKDVIRRVARRTGYRPIIEQGPPDHCAFLLHPDTTTDSHGTVPLSARTWVSKLVAGAHDDGMHRANSMNWVKYRYKGQKYVDAVVHIVPSHKVRLAAALARVQIGVLATWLGVRRRFAAVSGDFNETLRDRWKVLGALSLIATGFSDPGGTFGDRDIDHWWFLKRQLKSRKVTVQAEALHGYHSDHRPLLVRIRRNR